MAMAATHARISLSLLAPLTVKAIVADPRFRRRRSFAPVRAGPGDGNEGSSSNSLLKLKEEEEDGDDSRYVLKLGVGSVAGAAVIKYGSVLVPQFTTPNLPEALFIIITPVIAAVLVLLAKSKKSP